ncbi:MAG: NAD(P)/FAD-dependent oxidoreductase, partial [Candidatus Nanopelagicales bacterium]
NIKPKRVEVLDHVVDAKYVVRATEAYTTQLAGEKRTLAPIYSFMIATEVLPENTVSSLALNGSTFADLRNLVIYGQITKDNRIAFGGRGAPYHFGSKISASYEKNPEVSKRIFSILQEMFPSIGNVEITHQWAGVLGIFRDWYPRVSFEKETGFAYAGGYIGDGVGSSALAGKTLAHLISDTPTHLTELPWLNRPIRRWEIEPLRYLGISFGLNAMTFADYEEKITKRPSIIGKLMSPLIGH